VASDKSEYPTEFKSSESPINTTIYRRNNLMAITLSKVASERITEYMVSRGHGVGVRVGVRTTGCSGLAYVVEFVDDIEENDTVFVSNDISIVVDAKGLTYLDGTELDYGRDGLNEGFKFNNPNAKDECGCGESFSV
jgi:iron-sulfur cluster assembly protein